ncbi:MAG: glycosyltransferase family 9 protein, partial [Magnetococcales bacterium]|nr:glycosyltransferase family 9 protein [Magnetococcales bacterium]
MKPEPGIRILVMRKDNIGDLVCTTPLFASLRHLFPHAFIGALVTEYNTPVLAGNPDLDRVWSYQKAKHRGVDESWLGVYARRARLFWQLNRMNFDWILLPGGPHPSAVRAARLLQPRRLLIRSVTPPGAHEVECVLQLIREMGMLPPSPPPATRIYPDPAVLSTLPPLPEDDRRLVGVHISARKPAQRWPAERFSELIRALHDRGARVALFWSPGVSDNPLHPGDDDKARAILQEVGDLAVT